MNAEIIAVGSELLSYNRTDTNSLWLTARLNELGVEVPQKCIVTDDRARIARAVRETLERSTIVILTGGLGPTEDDLTREGVADGTGRALYYEASLFEAIEKRFARLGRQAAERNRRQCFVLEGAEVLPNPNGTAPGLWLRLGEQLVVLLPGPPAEMIPMVENEVLPRLRPLVPPAHIRTKWFRVSGMGESDLDQLIAPLYGKYSNPVTTILAKAGDLEIHLRARSETAEEAQRLVDELGAQIEGVLGDRLYSRNGEPLASVVGDLLKQRHATLVVAESCTGGLLGARITEIAGSSAYFLGGLQVYGASMKTRLLGVDLQLVERHGAVSEEVAQAMVDSIRDRSQATYALSITGEAGPVSSTPGIEPGTVWIGVASPERVYARQFRFPGDRARVRGFAVQTALNLLRLELLR